MGRGRQVAWVCGLVARVRSRLRCLVARVRSRLLAHLVSRLDTISSHVSRISSAMQAANGADVCSLRLSMLSCVCCGCVSSLRLSILCACLCAQEKQLLVLHRARHVCRRQLCPQHTSPPATAPLVILRLVSGVFGLERALALMRLLASGCGCARKQPHACLHLASPHTYC